MKPTELTSARVRVHIEDFVDDGVEIHEPRVFSQVILWFAQECVRLVVAAMNCDFTRFCKGLHNINFIREACNFVVTDPRIDNQGSLNYYGMLEDLGGMAGGENLSSRTSGEEWPSTTLVRVQSTVMA